MSRRNIGAFIIALLLLIPSVKGRAQASDSVALRALLFLQQLHSGSIRYVTKSEGGAYNDRGVDTTILVFWGLDDSNATSFILDRGPFVEFFDSGIYVSANRKLRTYTKRSLTVSQAFEAIKLFDSYTFVSRGAGLKALLEDSSVKRKTTSEVVNGHQHFILTFHIPRRDSDVKNIAVRVFLNDRAETISTKMTYDIWGAPYSEERSIIHASYNWSDSSEMRKAMKILKAAAADYRDVTSAHDDTVISPSHFTIGSDLPDLSGITIAGDTIRLSSIDAKLTILDFWFAGCAPCHHMFPFLKRLQEKYGTRGLKIIGIDPIDAQNAAERMVKFEGLNYDNLVVARSAEKTFDTYIYPTLYLLDAEKKLLWIKIGEGPTEAIETIIKQKLGD